MAKYSIGFSQKDLSSNPPTSAYKQCDLRHITTSFRFIFLTDNRGITVGTVAWIVVIKC